MVSKKSKNIPLSTNTGFKRPIFYISIEHFYLTTFEICDSKKFGGKGMQSESDRTPEIRMSQRVSTEKEQRTKN